LVFTACPQVDLGEFAIVNDQLNYAKGLSCFVLNIKKYKSLHPLPLPLSLISGKQCAFLYLHHKTRKINMFYRKNLYTWEQRVRVLMGLAIGTCGLIVATSPILKGIILFSALISIVTGFIGFCPACAMVGKKLKDD
jgi:Protein of unknown function (DUF2892)